MSYRTILVHLDSIEKADGLMRASVALAQQHDAHLIGIYVVPVPQVYVSAEVVMPSESIEEHVRFHRKRCDELKAVFDKATANTDFVSEWHELVADSTSIAGTVIEMARTVDFVVLGQKDADPVDHASRDLPEGVVLDCGRPVIVVPNNGVMPQSLENVFVAWDGSLQATRAVFNALPVLRKATNVRVHRVNPKSKDRHRILNISAELVNTLTRHGVNITLSESDAAGADVGDEIIEYVRETGSDLLVMGAYGHTRLREYLFGGTTRNVLQSMTVPVLMSH